MARWTEPPGGFNAPRLILGISRNFFGRIAVARATLIASPALATLRSRSHPPSSFALATPGADLDPNLNSVDAAALSAS